MTALPPQRFRAEPFESDHVPDSSDPEVEGLDRLQRRSLRTGLRLPGALSKKSTSVHFDSRENIHLAPKYDEAYEMQSDAEVWHVLSPPSRCCGTALQTAMDGASHVLSGTFGVV